MNPLRSMFLFFSRIPPAAMLLLMIGMAAVAAIVVTNGLNDDKARLAEQKQNLENQLNAKGKLS